MKRKMRLQLYGSHKYVNLSSSREEINIENALHKPDLT